MSNKKFKTIKEKGIVVGWFKYDKKIITSYGTVYCESKSGISYAEYTPKKIKSSF